MRVAVLPREGAASVITGAVSRMAWAFAIVQMLLVVPVLVETLLRAGRPEAIPLPLALALAQLLLLAVAARIARPWAVLGYLALGAPLCGGFQLAVIAALPGAVPDALFLVNRPAVALIGVGVTATSTLTGIAWVVLGFSVSVVTTGIVSVLAGTPFATGYAPAVFLGSTIAAYSGLALIQRRSRARVPDFDQLEAETQALVEEVSLSRRTSAVVHDTVLNDLAIVMNGPDVLDERTRARLRADLATLTGAEWLTVAHGIRPPDEQDARVRNAIAEIISDFQWRGLTVRISGVSNGINHLDPALVDAMIDGIRAALENVLRHSGASAAEVAFAADDRAVTVMVVDHGDGFDLAAVEAERLGLRESIVRRVVDAGGSVRVWSSPGSGTSVIMAGPIQSIILRDDGGLEQGGRR
ncbi:MAG: hypothetical protein HY996_07935 [Micrococcales bacterium]|nr:hypothetical protein [Micrococcales bacterium]